MAGKGAVHQGTEVDFHKGMLVRGACRGQVGGRKSDAACGPEWKPPGMVHGGRKRSTQKAYCLRGHLCRDTHALG